MHRIINIFRGTEQRRRPRPRRGRTPQIYDYACFNAVGLKFIALAAHGKRKFNNNYISFNTFRIIIKQNKPTANVLTGRPPPKRRLRQCRGARSSVPPPNSGRDGFECCTFRVFHSRFFCRESVLYFYFGLFSPDV